MVDSLSASFNGPISRDPLFDKALKIRSLSARSNSSICEGPSKISGPIVSHYGYENEQEKNMNKILDFSKYPKVRGEGLQNFKAHKDGTGVGLLICSEKPEQLFRERRKPKNHMVSNTLKIREIMKKVRERQQQKERTKNEKSAPLKAVDKFEHVESKVKELMIRDLNTSTEPKHEFLRAHSRPGSAPIHRRPHTAREASKEESAEKKAAEQMKSKDDIDFIRHNRNVVKQMQMRRAPSVESLRSLQEKTNQQFDEYINKRKGKVPEYIEKRREELRKAHEEHIKNLPDPEQPPGHRKLPEDERIKTLGLLKESHKKMLGYLNSLPIRNDTYRMQQLKSEYEKRLAEIEEAIKIFSKPKVFVKIDS